MNDKLNKRIIEDKLSHVKYKTDKNSHIIVDEMVCEKCTTKECLYVCPARVYSEVGGKIKVEYENCLECGVCKISCPKKAITWSYPESGYGVVYKYS